MKIQLSDLSVYQKQIEIIYAVAAQIQKDFEGEGEQIFFSGNAETAYTELKTQVVKIISGLIRDNFGKFLSLLYRIDIDEKAIRDILSGPAPDFEENVARLILNRELKKVIIRMHFSGS